jgi:DNA ligase D-like protein (predicted polymerase)
MPSGAVEVQAGERTVRVTSPDRVIYEETATTPAATKLQVVEYYLAVEEGVMRALRDRPTALERWPQGVREGMRLATRSSTRDAEAFYSKRMPKGAPDWVEGVEITFPSGRPATEVCPTEIATVAWAAQMGTITFHPWPVRRGDVDRPDELRLDLDPQPGTDFADAARVALAARDLLSEVGLVGFPKTSGNRGIHVYVRLVPDWDFVDVRHAAIAFGRELERRTTGVTTSWWKEERGANIFVDFNQNCRDRTIAGAYSLRPIAGAPASTPVDWEELDGLDPRSLNLHTVPARLAERGDAMAAIDDHAGRLDTLLQMYADDLAGGLTDLPYPPDYPKMPGEPPRVQPSRINPLNWDTAG